MAARIDAADADHESVRGLRETLRSPTSHSSGVPTASSVATSQPVGCASMASRRPDCCASGSTASRWVSVCVHQVCARSRWVRPDRVDAVPELRERQPGQVSGRGLLCRIPIAAGGISHGEISGGVASQRRSRATIKHRRRGNPRRTGLLLEQMAVAPARISRGQGWRLAGGRVDRLGLRGRARRRRLARQHRDFAAHGCDQNDRGGPDGERRNDRAAGHPAALPTLVLGAGHHRMVGGASLSPPTVIMHKVKARGTNLTPIP